MAINIKVEKNHIVISTDSSVFDDNEAKESVEKLKAQTESRPLVVFDLLSVPDVPLQSLRTLTRALSAFAQHEARVAVIGTRETCKLIKDQGLDRIFSCHLSLSEVVNDPSAAKQRALEFLNTTLEAVAYTLQVSTNTKATPGKTYMRGSGPDIVADVAATVGIISAPFNGALIVGFPLKTYLGIMSRLLGQEFNELTDEIRDGAAELLNIILGQVKVSLNEKGFAIKQAIPTVVHGEKVRVMPSSSRPSIIVPYTTDIGDFYIELSTNPAKN
ncbi:MAG: hypothetical protein A2583_00095 [Bdellovibrionales bacterium RIFOXYD1_FULL_53_11]|nr:MAG: hypothetical protein A2583_00095 [Bdellovibrionales bacterium RIFOXYD1_FULL_53_11]